MKLIFTYLNKRWSLTNKSPTSDLRANLSQDDYLLMVLAKVLLLELELELAMELYQEEILS